MWKLRLRGDKGVTAQGSWWGVAEQRTEPRSLASSWFKHPHCLYTSGDGKTTPPPPSQASSLSESREIFCLYNFNIKWSNPWSGRLESGCKTMQTLGPPRPTQSNSGPSLFSPAPWAPHLRGQTWGHSHRESGNIRKNLFLCRPKCDRGEIFFLSGPVPESLPRWICLFASRDRPSPFGTSAFPRKVLRGSLTLVSSLQAQGWPSVWLSGILWHGIHLSGVCLY